MKKKVVLCFFIIFLLFGSDFTFAQQRDTDFASSPNPVGSGARALGMGGAFIGVADDATAASWNPAGLVQLKWPEISVVGNWFHRTEDSTLGTVPESNESQSVSEQDINYLSIAYPFNLFNRNMIVSLNYQHLYDFTREWEFSNQFMADTPAGKLIADDDTNYERDGSLSALGVAYCVQIVPQFSFGFTLNFWEDDLLNNEWEEKTHIMSTQTLQVHGLPPGIPVGPSSVHDYKINDRYSFSGFNANLGVLWHATDKLTIGGVFKFPFTADIRYERRISEKVTDSQGETLDTFSYDYDEELDMPMSYGMGVAYRFSDQFTLSADVYRTEWQDFIYKDSTGNEKSPITNKGPGESDIDATHQIRIGAEYLFIDQTSDYVIPLRGGMFYDPAPAEGGPDDFYGVSLGSGIAVGRYVFDIACQYRFGNDVAESSVRYYDFSFSQDVNEFMMYSSLIIHF
ncbi:OmpP1/FadL family transporter [Desulfonema magnum]|uniref:Outer membrane protein transport protein domain-containing protein n=1 Tax=Desulfonema magnum TaxID=45655 RepID=A0A975BHU5_9BACT|nr:outer membrane protein transport protein [Desulfonema magnum]QTA85550.1 Outer membrane protein transport protein domain-containing protein [Desulfonema magnum]